MMLLWRKKKKNKENKTPKKFRESLAAQSLSQVSLFLSKSQSQIFP